MTPQGPPVLPAADLREPLRAALVLGPASAPRLLCLCAACAPFSPRARRRPRVAAHLPTPTAATAVRDLLASPGAVPCGDAVYPVAARLAVIHGHHLFHSRWVHATRSRTSLRRSGDSLGYWGRPFGVTGDLLQHDCAGACPPRTGFAAAPLFAQAACWPHSPFPQASTRAPPATRPSGCCALA